MRILLSGYYGHNNVGDEAVREAIGQGFTQRDPKIEIHVLPGSRLSWLDTIFKICRADVLISGGGTLFQDATSSWSFYYYIGVIWLAKLLGKKVFVFAQGFGPLKMGINRKIAVFTLNRVDGISLRDRESYEELKRLGVSKSMEVTADPSFLFPVPDVLEGKRILALEGLSHGRRLLGVAIRNVSRSYYVELAKVLDGFIKKHEYQVVFLPFQCPADMVAINQVMAAMQEKSAVIFRVCRPKEMLSLIACLDLLIGMRLHALIFAAMSAVPLIGISYDPKVGAFLREINQPGVGVDDIENIEEKADYVLANREAIKNELTAQRQRLCNKAERNFDLFFGKGAAACAY
jgi:polysaccharide pyruvyl transferase CsaB